MEAQIISTGYVFTPITSEPEHLLSSQGMVWGLVRRDAELRWLWLELKKDMPSDICIDFETYGPVQEWTEKHFIEADTAKVAGLAIAWGSRTFYVSVGHTGQQNVTHDAFTKFLESLFQQSFNIIAHNFDYELRVMKNLYGHYLEKKNIIDTMVIAYMLCKGVPKVGKKGISYAHGLKELAKYELGIDMTKYDDVVGGRKQLLDNNLIDDIKRIIEETPKKRGRNGSGLTQKSVDEIAKNIKERLKKSEWQDVQINQTDQREAGQYAAADALIPLKLMQVYRPLMTKSGLWSVYYDVVAPFLYTVAELNSNGVFIDKDHLQAVEDTLLPRAAAIAEEWEQLVGCSISSNQQCSDKLFGENIWPKDGIRKTSTGHYIMDKSTVKVVLRSTEPGSLAHKLAKMKQQYNDETKTVSTYTKPTLIQLRHRANGRAKSSFSLVHAKTGRLSSRDPNYQNIPRSDEEKLTGSVRKAFIAEPGNVLVVGDWSGLELVVMAHYSLDDLLVRSIRDGIDLHTETATKLGIPRPLAKNLRFGMQYGAYPNNIAQQLECSVEKATQLFHEFHAMHPKVGEFSKNVISFAVVHGYVETFLGRRRYVPFINEFDFKKRSKAEREAVNGVVQGTATDVAIVAGNLIRHDFRDQGLKARILLQIHDEYVVEAPESEAELVEAIMQHRMTTCVKLNVPLRAEIGVGQSWADCK